MIGRARPVDARSESPVATTMADGLRERHRKQLLILTLSSQVSIQLLLFFSSYLPLFDSSPWAVLDGSSTSWATSSFLRWDVFHLRLVGEERMYEHQWAFLPGAPAFIKFLGQIAPNDDWGACLQVGTLLVIACDSTLVLYALSLRHLKSPSLSFLSAALSLLPSSPATLRHAMYAEPFFTWASYRGCSRSPPPLTRTQHHLGMLACAGSQWALASFYFCLAGVFRSNGILLSGFILWGMLVEPFVKDRVVSRPYYIAYIYLCLLWLKLVIKRIPYALFLSFLIFSPVIYHQYSGYRVFCQDADTPAPWCSNSPPLIYTYVQSKYWNVGFLRYWTLQQLPNFFLAAPVLALLSCYSTRSVHSFATHLLNRPRCQKASPFEFPSLAPHGIHAFVFTLILVFASHTQIILRFAASLPFTYWSAARLLVENPWLGKWWVGWSVVWGAISLVLWSTFLPPA